MDRKNRNPSVSVIIPTYNRVQMLEEAVDSVLSQHDKDFELIVVDDGSRDNTGDILGSYGPEITVIKQDNRGVSAARNKGISRAKGGLIAFLDSDDLWLPDKLGIQTGFFNKNPDALICQTEETWIRNGTRVNPGHRHRKQSGMIFEASLELCLVSPSAVMARRTLFEQAGMFDESLPACEDYDLWLRVSCRFPIYLIDTPLIIKRGGHADQLSQMPGLDKYRIRSITGMLDSGLLTQDQRAAAVRVLKEKCTIFANGCRKRGRTEEADHYIALGSRYV